MIRVPHRRTGRLTRKRALRLAEAGLRRALTPSFWRARLPGVATAATDYSWEKAAGDAIAGVTTALTIIPQGIGYAPLAGLPLQVSTV